MHKRISTLVVLLVLAAFLVVPALAQEQGGDPITIHFFAGGHPGCSYAVIVHAGAMAAAEILGPRVEVKVWWSHWSSEKMISQFQKAVAMRPDGIVIMGHPGDAAFGPFVEEAKALGIIVTTADTPLHELEARFGDKGFGYVGVSDLHATGFRLGEETIKRAGLVAGDRVFVWGLKAEPVRGLRSWGTYDAFRAAGLVVDYLEISPEVNADPILGIPIIVAHLLANPDTKAVVTDHGGMTSALIEYFRAAGLGPGDVFGAGFDLSPAVVEGIREGYIGVVMDHLPFLQGFLPVMQIYLTYTFDFPGLHIDTGGASVIHAGNIEVVAALAEAGYR